MAAKINGMEQNYVTVCLCRPICRLVHPPSCYAICHRDPRRYSGIALRRRLLKGEVGGLGKGGGARRRGDETRGEGVWGVG